MTHPDVRIPAELDKLLKGGATTTSAAARPKQ
jgi:hypothetical protein